MRFKKDNIMNNYTFVLIDISKSLQRIASALEESNKMIKDLGGKND